MNKILIIIVGIIVVVGMVFYLTSQKISQVEKDTNPTTPDSRPTTTQEAVNTRPATRYLEYSPTVLDETSATKRVLFFYANWCPTCRPSDAEFSSNSQNIPEGVSVIRVNYNDTETDQNEKDLAKKYEVTYQHTFVQIDDSGEVVNRWNGGGLEELRSRIK